MICGERDGIAAGFAVDNRLRICRVVGPLEREDEGPGFPTIVIGDEDRIGVGGWKGVGVDPRTIPVVVVRPGVLSGCDSSIGSEYLDPGLDAGYPVDPEDDPVVCLTCELIDFDLCGERDGIAAGFAVDNRLRICRVVGPLEREDEGPGFPTIVIGDEDRIGVGGWKGVGVDPRTIPVVVVRPGVLSRYGRSIGFEYLDPGLDAGYPVDPEDDPVVCLTCELIDFDLCGERDGIAAGFAVDNRLRICRVVGPLEREDEGPGFPTIVIGDEDRIGIGRWKGVGVDPRTIPVVVVRPGVLSGCDSSIGSEYLDPGWIPDILLTRRTILSPSCPSNSYFCTSPLTLMVPCTV
ncbi:MAG: hypothetical protein IPI01_15825 [Ignavibacteriae bacterium]|nr:hypothetical protein [Ignavibacteriota bacterium]